MDATVPISAPRIGIRFSLRSLLVGLGAACVLLAPVHWFGGAYLFSASSSIFLIFVCALAYCRAPASTILPAGIGLVLGFLLAIGFLVFFLHALANGIACLILIAIRPRPRIFTLILVGVMVAVYGFAFSQGAAKLSEIRELRTRYPFEALSSRLAFERSEQSRDTNTVETNSISPVVAANLVKQDQFQDQHQYFSRAEALRELHEDSSAEFARAAGFGFMRMPSLTYRLVDFERPEKLSLPISLGISQPLSSNNELDSVHHVAVSDFLSPDRMGYIKSRDAVAGFESHQFNTLGGSWEREFRSAKHWQVIRLELVGLLREEPRVYVSETLPQLDKIVEAPHRPLNEFESGALLQLALRMDIVVDAQPGRVQMLGALRAGKSCLQCHEGERGKLLGAFSYEIVPVPAVEETTTAIR